MNPTTTHTPGAHRLTEAEIETAFNYCDVHGTGLVTAAGLKARLGPLLNNNKGAAALDCSALLGGKPALTLPELKAALLAPDTIKGGGHHTRTPTPVPVPVPTTATAAAVATIKGKGDAVAEAFGLMADRTGHIGREALAQWLRAVDFVAATERDLE